MKKFEIYQLGKLPPLTVVEAKFWRIDKEERTLEFLVDGQMIAVFNFNNIAGFKELTGNE